MDKRGMFERCFIYAPAGMALLSERGIFLEVNPFLCRMLGLEAHELQGESERYRAAAGEPLLSEEAALLRQGEYPPEHIRLERKYRHATGHEVWMSVSLSLLPGGGGEEPLLLAHFDDITEQRRREELRNQESELYEMISEHTQDVIGFGVGGRLEYISPASLRRVLGYSPQEWMGSEIHRFIHPGDLESMRGIEVKETQTFVCRIRHSRGHYIPFEVSVKRIPGKHGEPDRAVYIGRDMSDWERAQSDLRESERRLAQAQQMARLGNWEWELGTNQIGWSSELYRIFRLEPIFEGSCSREEWVELFHPHDRRAVLHAMDRGAAGQAFELECRTLNAGGMTHYIRMQGVPLHDDHGSVLSVQGTVQDISGQKMMLQMLEESVDRYTSLKKYNLDSVLSLNPSGVITSANPAAEITTGYSALDMIGRPFTELIHASELERVRAHLYQIMHEGLLVSIELKLVHRSGGIRDLLATPAPIIVGGRQVGCYIIAKDITEQKRKDELLLKSEKLSIAGQLAAGVAHEIRNPLTALMGFVQLMSRADTPSAMYLQIMKEELERIETIISELLMLAKPQAVQLRVSDLNTIVQDVIMLLGTQASLQNIEIVFLRPQAAAAPILCDPNQIKQVFINMLKNALESMPGGGTITVEVEAGEPSDDFSVVRITDEGCGIPKEQLHLIGEPFYSTKEAGTGLGMLVSHKIIEHHGGRVRVDSEVGAGTVVEVSLPLVRQDEGYSSAAKGYT